MHTDEGGSQMMTEKRFRGRQKTARHQRTSWWRTWVVLAALLVLGSACASETGTPEGSGQVDGETVTVGGEIAASLTQFPCSATIFDPDADGAGDLVGCFLIAAESEIEAASRYSFVYECLPSDTSAVCLPIEVEEPFLMIRSHGGDGEEPAGLFSDCWTEPDYPDPALLREGEFKVGCLGITDSDTAEFIGGVTRWTIEHCPDGSVEVCLYPDASEMVEAGDGEFAGITRQECKMLGGTVTASGWCVVTMYLAGPTTRIAAEALSSGSVAVGGLDSDGCLLADSGRLCLDSDDSMVTAVAVGRDGEASLNEQQCRDLGGSWTGNFCFFEMTVRHLQEWGQGGISGDPAIALLDLHFPLAGETQTEPPMITLEECYALGGVFIAGRCAVAATLVAQHFVDGAAGIVDGGCVVLWPDGQICRDPSASLLRGGSVDGDRPDSITKDDCALLGGTYFAGSGGCYFEIDDFLSSQVTPCGPYAIDADGMCIVLFDLVFQIAAIGSGSSGSTSTTHAGTTTTVEGSTTSTTAAPSTTLGGTTTVASAGPLYWGGEGCVIVWPEGEWVESARAAYESAGVALCEIDDEGVISLPWEEGHEMVLVDMSKLGLDAVPALAVNDLLGAYEGGIIVQDETSITVQWDIGDAAGSGSIQLTILEDLNDTTVFYPYPEPLVFGDTPPIGGGVCVQVEDQWVCYPWLRTQ